jgi:hypothetical protein
VAESGPGCQDHFCSGHFCSTLPPGAIIQALMEALVVIEAEPVADAGLQAALSRRCFRRLPRADGEGEAAGPIWRRDLVDTYHR